jgi:hypothetical protein
LLHQVFVHRSKDLTRIISHHMRRLEGLSEVGPAQVDFAHVTHTPKSGGNDHERDTHLAGLDECVWGGGGHKEEETCVW